MRLSGYGAIAVAGMLGLGVVAPAGATPTNFSFTGNFSQDDDVQLFNFVVGAPSSVTLRAWSYAGGVNAAGQVIARGGFDTILAVFDSSGLLINQNDDGGSNVAADALTGLHYDTYLQVALGAGSYRVSVMQYNNFAIGPNLSNGFSRDGDGNFTPLLSGTTDCEAGQFVDVSGSVSNHGNCRDSHWAFDILNVEGANETNVPEPTTMTLMGLGLAGLWSRSRRRA
jgi:hypothetical protein